MILTKNPWEDLSLSKGSYILEIDCERIRRYNESVRDEAKRVIVGSIPEPFIGNPESAKIVLLNLNPGHSDNDSDWHGREGFKKAMFLNLHHGPQEFPFYPLNPDFQGNGAGEWWRPRTRELQTESGLDDKTFAERLLVIEWFPYHSQRSALPKKPVCESQKYSFQLAKQMLEKKGVEVVGMRSRKRWAEVDPRFGALGGVRFLKNPQCGYVTRGNTEGYLFDEIVKALKGNP